MNSFLPNHSFRLPVFTMLCMVTIALFSHSVTAEDSKLLATVVYKDPHGFFQIYPPMGWSIKDYPNDPRGKVKFTAPGVKGVSLLVIGMSTDMKDVDQIIASTKQGHSTLKRKYQQFNPFGSYEIIQWDGLPAVKGHFEIPGRFKQESYEFLYGEQYYNPSYVAPPSVFGKYREQVMLSIRSLEPVFQKRSAKEAKTHLAESKLRIAQLNIQVGRPDMALEAIQEGLAIDPTNTELLKLRKSLDKN